MQDTRALPSLDYRDDVDGLRAVAVMLVLVFHFDLFASGKAGFLGVDVFFVISGYLITAIVLRELGAGRFALGRFYLRRVRRLAPALFATLALTLAAGAVLLLPADFAELSRQTLAAQFYVANLYYWKHVNYFGLGAGDSFLLHTWSLAVEEQFYLLYPLVLLLLHRALRRHVALAIGLALLASFALNVALVGPKPEATFYLLPTRAWELLVGGWLAAAGIDQRLPRRAGPALGWLGAALIALSVLLYRDTTRFPGAFALLPVLGAAAVIAARGGPVSRLLAQPPVVYVGKISYPLYLVHWPVHLFAGRWLQDRYDVGWRAAMLLLSMALAASIYHLLEQPLRERRVLRIERRLLGAYAGGLAVTLACVGVIRATGGLPQRFPDEVTRLAAFADDKSPPLSDCEFSLRHGHVAVDRCRIGSPEAPPRWIVIGDSHAWATHAAFDQWLRLKGEAGYFAYRNSCPPLTGVHVHKDRGECFAFNGAVHAFLAARPDVRHVVLVSTWRQAPEGRLTAAPDEPPSRSGSIGVFASRFAATVESLHAAGRQVFVWEPLPGALGKVPEALARAALDGKPATGLMLTRQRYLDENSAFFAALEGVRPLLAGSFSPSEALCRTGRCVVEIDGKPLYFDNNHVTLSSAPLWVRVMQHGERVAGAAVEGGPR